MAKGRSVPPQSSFNPFLATNFYILFTHLKSVPGKLLSMGVFEEGLLFKSHLPHYYLYNNDEVKEFSKFLDLITRLKSSSGSGERAGEALTRLMTLKRLVRN